MDLALLKLTFEFDKLKSTKWIEKFVSESTPLYVRGQLYFDFVEERNDGNKVKVHSKDVS